MFSYSFIVSLLFLLPTIAIASEQQCYGLDGTPLDDTYAPCKSGARHSGCCATNRPAGSADICLDSGLCMATNGPYIGAIFQDGCTDATGKDAGCPKMCPDARDNFNNLNKVQAWNMQMCDYGSYCCRAAGDHNNCCNNATAPHITTSFLGAIQLPTSMADLNSTTSTPSATTTATLTPTSTNAPSSIPPIAISTAEAFPLSSPTSTALPQSTCPKDNTAVVGGAIGGILGAAILALIGLILWMHKKEKHQRKLKEHYEEQFGQNFAYRRTVVVESDGVELLDSRGSRDEKEEGR